MSSAAAPAQQAIDVLVQRFFAVFDNRAGRRPDFATLEALFAPHARIAKHGGLEAEHMSLSEFLLPREALLLSGELQDFHEWELASETLIFGGMASRNSHYRKSGRLHNAAYEGEGMKSFHFLLTEAGWRISAIVWADADASLPIAAVQRRLNPAALSP